MDRYYHRDAAAYRAAERRAVQDVETAGLPRQTVRVPPGIADDRRRSRAPAPGEPLVLVVGEQRSDVAGRPGLRLDERRGVEAYAHAENAWSMTRPVSSQRKRFACASPRGTSPSRPRSASSTAAPIASGSSGRHARRRRRRPRPSTGGRRRRPARRPPSPRRSECRTPRNATGRRTRRRPGRGARARRRPRSRAGSRRGGRATAAAPSLPRRRRRARGLPVAARRAASRGSCAARASPR